MIESVIFYSSFSGITLFELGKNITINNDINSSDYFGGLFYIMSQNKNCEIINNELIMKSKNNHVVCLYKNNLMLEVKNKNYGIIGSIFPEKQNIFMNTMIEFYSIFEDESLLLNFDYSTELINFMDIFSEKFKKTSSFNNLKIDSLKQDYELYSNSLLSSIDELNYLEDSNLYHISKEMLIENKKFIDDAVSHKKNLELTIKEYNLKNNSDLSFNSSIIFDYGKLSKLFKYIETTKSLTNSAQNEQILKQINSRINLMNSHSFELNQAINEAQEFNFLINKSPIYLHQAYKKK
jgi:hypothetical protein